LNLGPLGFNGSDRAFFFVNLEELRWSNQATRNRTIFHPATQQGVFQHSVQVGGQPRSGKWIC
jgi:hypothetical protein